MNMYILITVHDQYIYIYIFFIMNNIPELISAGTQHATNSIKETVYRKFKQCKDRVYRGL